MESFSLFDLIIAAIVLLLGLKGLLNGFFKELFGLIGIIGGIFVASRFDVVVGEWISATLFPFESTAAATFTGFLVTLAAFWLGMTLIGSLFSTLSAQSGLGILNKLLGFLFGSGKIFLILSMIAYSVSHIKWVESYVNESMKSSLIYPLLVETGSYIIKIDPKEITQQVTPEMSASKSKPQVEEEESNMTSTVIKEVTDAVENVTNELSE